MTTPNRLAFGLVRREAVHCTVSGLNQEVIGDDDVTARRGSGSDFAHDPATPVRLAP